MAKYTIDVLLGFEDEPITDKFKGQTNFTVNKIGGIPDYSSNVELDLPKCPLCQLPRPLVVQIYAPLDNSSFHRTLYLFACINPNCWNSNESWLCIRVQSQENIIETTACMASSALTSALEWCADADNWDDTNANCNEENGNLINSGERISDEEDESCSLEDSLRSGFGNLTFSDNDKNANKGAQGGAVGTLHSPAATAEIEGNEGEVISIDTPTFPQHDITSLLLEATPVPQEIYQSDFRHTLIQFSPFFMSVYDETSEKCTNNISDRHIKELLQEYQLKNIEEINKSSSTGAEAEVQEAERFEKYEKSSPAHGDKMFHYFMCKIQSNPGQILRYSRESIPLLLYNLQDTPNKKCQYCQSEMVFEFQLIPTIISKLKLVTDPKPSIRLDFGTVLVYTCRKSCWSTDSTLRVEMVILQTEVH